MERRIRRIGVFLILCFVAIFVQLNIIQVFKANSLANDPNNPSVVAVERSQTRGSIISADGVTLVSSRLAPKGSIDKYERAYNPYTSVLFAQITGFDSINYGTYGIEHSYNSSLTPHTAAAHSLRDLLTNRTEVDNVILTVNSHLQQQVAAALDGNAPGVQGAAAAVIDPSNGSILAAYSNPTYDPSPLVSEDIKTEKQAWAGLLLTPGNPLRPGSYDETYPPGSSFKVVTTSAVLQGRPDLATMTYPSVSSVVLPNTGNPPQMLTNYHNGVCPPAPAGLETLLILSCDADFAQIGQLLGAQALVNQAEAYGFNQRLPLDVPLSAISNFGTVADFAPTGQSGVPGLMKSAIGQQNVTASALQMAMVAGTVANGGVEMTPHFMSQIRDSQGNLIQTYTPHQWMQPISAQTASILTGFMQGVVQSGTAANIFPASWHVAAKTGTAQTGSFGPNPQFTDDWLISFAPVGNQKVAIAVVLPQQPGSATGAERAGPIVKEILGDVLSDHGLA